MIAAPVSAITDDSIWSTLWSTNAATMRTIIIMLFIRRDLSFIRPFSSIAMTLSIASFEAESFLP